MMTRPTKAFSVIERVQARHYYLVYAHNTREAVELAESGEGELLDKDATAGGFYQNAKRLPTEDRDV